MKTETGKGRGPGRPRTFVEEDSSESMKIAESKWGIPIGVLKVAKAAGCPAFVGHRIFRPALVQWLADNPEITKEGNEKTTEAELKRKKLQNEVTLGDFKIANESKKTIPRDEAKNEWARGMAIVQDEAKSLMERDHYRVFVERCRDRIGNIIE